MYNDSQIPSLHSNKKDIIINHDNSEDYEPADETKTSSVQTPMYPRSATSSFHQSMQPSKSSTKSKKSVSFHHTAFVVLIPTVQEYHEAGLGDLLWWNDYDFQTFKLSAAQEIKEIMKLNPELDAKRAMKLYFKQFNQPDNLTQTINTEANVSTASAMEIVDDEAEEEAAEDHYHNNEDTNVIPERIITQRQDSITENSHLHASHIHFSKEEFSHPHPEELDLHCKSDLEPIKSTSPPNVPSSSSSITGFPHCSSSPRSPETAESSSSSNEGILNGPSLDSVSVLARMMALGLLVFMNRN